MRLTSLLLSSLLAQACSAPSQERADLDEAVGRGAVEGLEVEIKEGLGVVREISEGALSLWASAPALIVSLEVSTPGPLHLTVHNCMPLSWLRLDGPYGWVESGGSEDTRGEWILHFEEAGRYTLNVEPPDVNDGRPFRFGVLSDIQEAVDEVDTAWAALSAVEGLRFIASTGDLTSRGSPEELYEIQRGLSALSVPLYSTLGNHELGGAQGDWQRIFGRGSFAFLFHETRFIFLDSGSATLAPKVYGWLDDWLQPPTEGLEDATNLIALTHVPLFDPVGLRSGAFRSRKEAQRLAARLSSRGVDLLFHGHIHSYYAYETAGIPTYISGGGGAIPERMDGIQRHALIVDVDPVKETFEVSILRVD